MARIRVVGRPDYLLLGVMTALLVVGLQAVYSASFAYALSQYGDVSYYVVRQGIWACLGFLLLLVFLRVDYLIWKRWSPWLLVLGLLLTAATLIPGVGMEVNGARRWLRMGPFPPLQPSEFVKLALIIYIAAWLSSKGEKLRQFSTGLLPFSIMVGLVSGLVLVQPDMGSSLIMIMVATTLFFVAGGALRHLSAFLLTGLVASVPIIVNASYRYTRMQSFLDPWQDPQGKGFHIIQSLIALGSGGIAGMGLGASRQKFFYVPGSHTDAIFAIIGEETGLIGSLLVLFLFAALGYRGFRIALGARDDFGALLAVGITTWILYQAVINIGGITRSIPFTGIPLPFISYGGSSLAATMAAVGLLLNVSKYAVFGRRARVAPASLMV